MIEKNASTQANYTFNRTNSLVMTSGIGAASRSPTRYSEQSYGIDRLEGQMILLYNNRIRIVHTETLKIVIPAVAREFLAFPVTG
jgi:hypothetical protein